MIKHRLTSESLATLKEEYNNLVNVERIDVINEIKVARDNGDLSENADYEAALNKQKVIETRILEIKAILDNHVLISDTEVGSVGDIVKIGSKVKILEIEDNIESEYEILGSVDNNPSMGRISNECPLAKSMLGKKVGDVVEVQNIHSPYKVKILNIS
ncbi:transcription elongation factor GreA [Candidatus Mycoplasma haematobovis]|uniref:Transcription elongation factor GreA n=1 Tax=Candidatus Mycoplasma haematobovis TaxID=432608 RepID=A0A1A9QD59_9MOLU|nr:transcription elongation factor GreA [Candidatus Mycoplasma haematobovis]OAL10393.1 transcription elongation factor GreA [Candidatus Mycoplasma haematobovis]